MFDLQKRVTNVGIDFPKNLTPEEHKAAGLSLSKIEHGLQWAIGDWYNSIPDGRFGDTDEGKQKACEEVELKFTTASAFGSVAERIPISNRIEILSFKHHMIVAALDEPLRNELLQDAVANGWSCAKLTKEKNERMGILPPPSAPDIGVESDLVDPEKLQGLEAMVHKGKLDKFRELFEDLFQSALDKAFKQEFKAQQTNIRSMNDEARKKLDMALKTEAGVKAFMTDDEYKIVLSCLHPDRECAPSRKQKAFALFKRMGDMSLRAKL